MLAAHVPSAPVVAVGGEQIPWPMRSDLPIETADEYLVLFPDKEVEDKLLRGAMGERDGEARV